MRNTDGADRSRFENEQTAIDRCLYALTNIKQKYHATDLYFVNVVGDADMFSLLFDIHP